MKKLIIFRISIFLAMLCLILILVLEPFDSKDTTIDIEGPVKATLLYTSRTTFDGITEVAYATGIFLEDGTYFRIVGIPDIEIGTCYRFTIIPDSYGIDWDELIRIKQQ